MNVSAIHSNLTDSHSDSGATNGTDIAHPFILLSISERCSVLSTGFAGISAVTGVANYIATIIKNQSDAHQCAVRSGNVDGVNYQYSASGRNCDTTSEQKTINAAVQKAINFMNDRNVNQTCFELTHGGTWKGHLQVAARNRQIIDRKCDSVIYNIGI